MSNSVYIVSGARTPMGSMLGSLSAMTAVELGTTAIAEAVKRASIDPATIEDVILGCGLPAGLKQGPARQAAIMAGIPKSTGAVTVNKLCGSGMQATIYAHDQIKAGSYDIIVAGGMESMTNAPHIVLNARKGVGTGGKGFEDHMFFDGLQDAYTGRMMGSFAQQTADDNEFTREQMDAYAIESLTRARTAIENGSLKAETAPVTVKTRKGETVVTDDEQPLSASIEKVATLRPAFAKDGTITAANASSISDGASAMVLMGEKALSETGAKPLARIVAHSRQSMDPSLFTVAPVGAMQKVLDKAGWTKDDVDLWEINEAFAMVTMLAIRDLELDHAKVNVHGGACAQGHPVGSTGARIIISLIYALQQYGKKRGVASLCIGGGEALAVAIELV
jgi:acetyl-CoA C-acetyltransferase